MKNVIKFLAMTAMASFALVSCNMEQPAEDAANAPKRNFVRVDFTTSQDETKAAFGEADDLGYYPAFWTAADTKVCMSMNMGSPVEGNINKPSEISKSATFSGDFEDEGAPYKFYALTPVSAVNGISESREAWSVSIPATQTPKADGLSCDESAMLLYAESELFYELPTEPINMKFKHVASYCRLTLKNIAAALPADAADAVVRTVDVTYSVPVAGNWYINVVDGSLTAKEASHTITINAQNLDISQPAELWFAMAPCTLDGQTVKVSVNTDKGRLSREYTYPSGRTYQAGAVNKLGLDMTKNSSFDPNVITVEETVYVLVNSLSEIGTDTELIFVNSPTNPTLAVSTATSNSGLGTTNSFTYGPSDKYIRLPEGSNVAIWTINGNTVRNSVGTLGISGQGQNWYPSYTNAAINTSVTNGNATMTTVNKQNKTYYYYFNGATFALANNNRTFAIFKKTTAEKTITVDPENDPILQQEQLGSYSADLSKVHVPHTSQISVQEKGSNVEFAILFPLDADIVIFSGIPQDAAKGTNFTLNLSRMTNKRVTNVGSYDVTVLKEEASKLWLSDLKGNGFIVKK